MKRTTNKLALACVISMLAGCGAEKPEIENELCQSLEGRIYYTDTLEVGGLTLDGAQKMHWSVKFEDGLMTYHQTDTLEAVEYTCYDGQIISPSADVIEFSDDLASLEITRFGGTWEYSLGVAEPSHSSCSIVEGRSYAIEGFANNGASNAANSDDIAGIAPASFPILSVEFGPGQQATYSTLEGQGLIGLYECTSDEMHLHRAEEDPSIGHAVVEVNRHGVDVKITTNDVTTVLPEVTEITVCDTSFQPVCGVRPENIQCLVAPCPSGFHETASNQCVAESRGLRNITDGECGDLEGEPFYDLVACTKEYRPVCGASVSTEPCTDLPCPQRVHKTFGNLCEANAAKAFVLSDDQCGDRLEGTPVAGDLPGACTQQYDPVCGKADLGLVCVTTPCPSHGYVTYGNQCGAGIAQATTVYGGECGLLQGVVVDGQPPAIMGNLPRETKDVNVVSSSIDGDILTVTLAYSGCDQQHFQLYISGSFMESNPVQTDVAFVPLVNDACEAVFTTEFVYDLLPLKAKWTESYQQQSGQVIIRGLGTYSF